MWWLWAACVHEDEVSEAGEVATQVGSGGTCDGVHAWPLVPDVDLPVDALVVLQVSNGWCAQPDIPTPLAVHDGAGTAVPGDQDMWTAHGYWPFETFAPDAELAADTAYRISSAGDWTNLPIDDWDANTFRTGSSRAAAPGTVEIVPAGALDTYDLAVDVPEASVLRAHADGCDDPTAGVLNAWGVSDGATVRFTAPSGGCVCAVVSNLAGVDGEPTTYCP